MSKFDRTVRTLADVLRAPQKSKTSPYDDTAEVKRIEGNTAWVHIPGGIDETPVQMTVNAQKGDIVHIRVADGRAWITGNSTAPPTDDRTAISARNLATTAQDTANTAQTISEQAVRDAETAHDAAVVAQASANAAQESANAAQESANAAQESANAAQGSATIANRAANDSLTQLSVVEDVIGVLNWMQEHGGYKPTEDTHNQPNKIYYVRSGSGTQADPYVYTVALPPLEYTKALTDENGRELTDEKGNVLMAGQFAEEWNPYSLGLYELTDVEEAVADYVSSHLALTNDGLWVLKDGQAYKILVSNNSVGIYDAQGHRVSEFGENIILDSSRPQYIGGENAYIIFYDSDNDGIPDSIDMGGENISIGDGRKLSDVLTSLDVEVEQISGGAKITIDGQTATVYDGASITGIIEYYCVTSTTEVPPDSAFSPNVISPTETNPYLWNFEQIQYSNGTTRNMSKHILMTYNQGEEGRGIASVDEYYALSNSTTAPADSAFGKAVQTVSSSNKYLWNYEVINYTDGINPTKTDKRIIGTYGEQGPRGIQGIQGIQGERGAKGDKGDSGRGITQTTIRYGISASSATEPTDWQTTIPSTLPQGSWLWTRTAYTYSDNTLETIDNKTYIGADGEQGPPGDRMDIRKTFGTNTITYTADVFLAGIDVSADSPSSAFEWYYSKQSGNMFIGNGRSITIPKNNYCQTVECIFTY